MGRLGLVELNAIYYPIRSDVLHLVTQVSQTAEALGRGEFKIGGFGVIGVVARIEDLDLTVR